MEGPRPRITVVLLCCLLSNPAIAGCLGVADVGDSDRTEVGELNGTETRGSDGTDVGDEEAKERALAAEEDYLTSQFENASCIEEWGLTAYGGIAENATISNRTVDGVYVEVTHPYWYGTGQDEVDYGSTALYLVTPDNVQRIDGDDISPC